MADLDLARKLRHALRSGVFFAGLDHFLAMFPATVLVPLAICDNDKFHAPIIDVSLVLAMSGIGTLLYLAVTRGKIPAYLGSSFAYISLTTYLVSGVVADAHVTPQEAFGYVTWGYLFAAFQLFVLGTIYGSSQAASLIRYILPNSIIGPAISLIGLELAETGAKNAGFTLKDTDPTKFAVMAVSLATFGSIVLLSIWRRSFLRNASIAMGVILGCLAAAFFGIPVLEPQAAAQPTWSVPRIYFLPSPPHDLLRVFLAVIPATLVIFTEHISRLTVIERLHATYRESHAPAGFTLKMLRSSLFGHAASTGLSALVGSVPTTIYAENIAVMSINSGNAIQREGIHDTDAVVTSVYNPLGIVPYIFAASLAILVSFLSVVEHVLVHLPKAIVGGMELFLFGIIAAPGIQLLVETGVNFRKLTNQILTGSVLVAGVSNFSFDFGIVELKGMSLGLAIGIFLNLVFRGLDWFGLLNERITFVEALEICFTDDADKKKLLALSLSNPAPDQEATHVDDIDVTKLSGPDILGILRTQHTNDGRRIPDADRVLSNIKHADRAEVGFGDKKMLAVAIKPDGTHLQSIALPEPIALRWRHDYPDCVTDGEKGRYNIRLEGQIPARKIRALLKAAFAQT